MPTRGQLGLGAVLTVSAAAAELGLREADARRWLRDRGLVRTLRLPPDADHPTGRVVERVPWRAVLDALDFDEGAEAPPPTPPRRRRLRHGAVAAAQLGTVPGVEASGELVLLGVAAVEAAERALLEAAHRGDLAEVARLAAELGGTPMAQAGRKGRK